MEFVPFLVISVCAIVASISDVREFRVYNALTFPCFFAGILFHSVTQGWTGLGYSLGGAALGFIILILPYMLGGLGAGDVKFVMAMGTWLGPQLLFPALIIGCVATGIYSLALILRNGGAKDVFLNVQFMFLRLAAFGNALRQNDQFESVQEIKKSSECRKRLIPFSAMFSLGIIGAFVFQFLKQKYSS